jgi:hypothetical protein
MDTPTSSRGKFSGHALMGALEEAEGAHAQGRDLHPHLLRDWKRYIEEQFELDDDQRADLDRLCDHPDEAIQRAVLEALSTPGETPRFTLEREPLGDDDFVNELMMTRGSDLQGANALAIKVTVTIAHCDANCKKWKWGRRR